MIPSEIITRLLLAGVQMSVAFEPDGEYLDLEPASAVTPDLVALVRQNKPALVSWFCDPRPPEPPVVEPWPPSGSPTPQNWANHYKAVFQAQQQAMVARANRRPRNDPPGWPPTDERTDS